ncbi:MAG: S46 family peptidase [Acidobacteriota bacterium]
MFKRLSLAAAASCLVAGAVVMADEGMWRLDQLPLAQIEQKYGVKLTPADIARVQGAVVRISTGGTGTFASANGLILTNHHVALDCIRTSTLAEQGQGKAENLIEEGFTAGSQAAELPCKRFRAQVEVSSRDVTSEVNAGVKLGMDATAIQRARMTARSDLERTCQQEKGDDFSCAVVDFNSGARSLLIVYEDYKDIRLVYAPEKQLGYFGGDEMNFRFPRYVSDISILRAYEGRDGRHTDYDAANVPVKPEHYLPVTMAGVKEGDFTFVAGNPGATNRYRMSFSAAYNVAKGIPDQIRNAEAQLTLLRKYGAAMPDYQTILQSQIFGVANSLKYSQDLLAALKASDVVAERQMREAEFKAWVKADPLRREFAGVLDAQRAVYANDVEANSDLDSALNWIQQSSAVAYAANLYEFALERAKPSDRDREPQFQERNWPDVRESLTSDDPVIADLDADLLAMGLERALALAGDQKIPAVVKLTQRIGAGATPASMAKALVAGTSVLAADARKKFVDASVADFDASTDPAVDFARDLLPTLKDQRARIRVLNEKLFMNRAAFARGLVAWKGAGLYPDANFTLRATFGRAAGYTDARGRAIPFSTHFGDLFTLAASRGNTGEFALPVKLQSWRQKIGDADFTAKYAQLPVNFVSTNDITGGNSGSATLNRRLEIVGLIFDGNEEAMAGDWVYSEKAGRALSTDIRFALTVARDVHSAGWIVDELLNPAVR